MASPRNFHPRRHAGAWHGPAPHRSVFAGNPVEAHRAGVDFVSRVTLEKIEQACGCGDYNVAGYPLDSTYYQGDSRALPRASHIVKRAGKSYCWRLATKGTGWKGIWPPVECPLVASRVHGCDRQRHVEIDQWQLEKLGLVAAKVTGAFITFPVCRRITRTCFGARRTRPQTPPYRVDVGVAPERQHRGHPRWSPYCSTISTGLGRERPSADLARLLLSAADCWTCCRVTRRCVRSIRFASRKRYIDPKSFRRLQGFRRSPAARSGIGGADGVTAIRIRRSVSAVSCDGPSPRRDRPRATNRGRSG